MESSGKVGWLAVSLLALLGVYGLSHEHGWVMRVTVKADSVKRSFRFICQHDMNEMTILMLMSNCHCKIVDIHTTPSQLIESRVRILYIPLR